MENILIQQLLKDVSLKRHEYASNMNKLPDNVHIHISYKNELIRYFKDTCNITIDPKSNNMKYFGMNIYWTSDNNDNEIKCT